MENKNPLIGFLMMIAMAVLIIVLFPPLLLVLAAAGIYFWFRVRSLRKQMEKELNEQQPQPTWQDDLFQEQVSRIKKDEDAEVIDVEFTRKDSNEEERRNA